MKEQGVIERLEGADITLELKKFISASPPYGPDYRKQFPKLAAKVAEIQHKGTTDLYSAFKSRSADNTSEMQTTQLGLASAPTGAKAALDKLEAAADEAKDKLDAAADEAREGIEGAIETGMGAVTIVK